MTNAKPLTVGELLVALDALPRELLVEAWYDAECAHGPVEEVRLSTAYDEPVAAIIVG